MVKPDDPRDLCVNLLTRSTCSIQVASVITDHKGHIISWGWNNQHHTGYGICAERHAILRSNRDRLRYGTIYVAGKYRDRNKLVNSKPCPLCQEQIKKYQMQIIYRNKQGEWM